MRSMKLGRLTLMTVLALGSAIGGISSASAQQADIIIRTAPPAPRAEARGSFRAGYEWVPGYWRWEGRRHVWVSGHWERARTGYVWQPARWERRYDGWVFIPGRWVRGGGRPTPPPVYDPPPPSHPGSGPYDGPPRYGRRHWERQGWVLLGEEWVSGGRRRADRDVIHIGRKEGRFYRLLLVVEDSDIELYDMIITFGNGTTYSPRLQHYFRENSRSRVIELPKGARRLRDIQFFYRNMPGGGRARVEVWAMPLGTRPRY